MLSCPIVDEIAMAASRTEANSAPHEPLTSESCAPGGLRVGTPRQFRWLAGVVKAVVVMNVIDAVLTLYWVRGGFATEANPLMEQIVTHNGLLFVVCKIALVVLGSTLLWRYRRTPLAVLGIFAAFLVYYAVLLMHLRFASLLVGQLFYG